MFSGAKQTMVKGGTFTSIHAPVTNIQVNHEKGIKHLRNNVASGAFHNSAERYDPPKCHPGTRKVITKEIMDWIETTDKEEFFLWLYGPAGAGKSAIAQSIAELCHEAGLLAATFFFSRTAAGRNDAALLISTLAYQLTVSIPEIIEYVSAAVEKDTLIFARSLEAQLEALIIKPLLKLTPHQFYENGGQLKMRPRVIIIDGLDECSQPKTQHYILTTLSSAVQRYRIPLCFIITSRPEQVIRHAFSTDTMTLLTRRFALDDTYKPDADIKIFLASKFATIKESHPLSCHIPLFWPSDSDLDHLIRKASGQFIYASTVIKFVESPRHRPTDRLDIVFGVKPPRKQTPFAELDALYTLIFTSIEDIDAVLDIFMFLLLFSGPQYQKERPCFVEAFWGYEPGDLQIILADLHSVVSVPSSQSKEQNLRLFHASLGDFLMDESRSGKFFINGPQAHARMAEYCIKHTSNFLEYVPSDSNMNDHLELSCEALMKECSNAYPTKELLQALGSFRFDMFLALPPIHNQGDRWRHTLVDLSEFLDWIQRQDCLRASYMAHIDYHLKTRLSNYPHSEPLFQHLFTAVTLNSSSCAFETSDFLYIVDRYNEYPSLENLDRCHMRFIDLMYSSDEYPNLRSMLFAFFSDRARSGRYYRDKSHYIDLAVKCLDYLRSPTAAPQLTHPSIQKSAWIITLDILSRFPRDHELVKMLCADPPIRKYVHRIDTLLTIEAYIKDYDLSIANAGQDLEGTSCTSSTSTPSNAMKRKGSPSELRRSKPFEQGTG